MNGRYLYCIINSNNELKLGNIGIEDSEAYIIPYKDIGVIVHSCKPEAYLPNNNETARKWILSHNYVIDCATNNFGTVLPFSFDSVIKGDDVTVKKWLCDNYENFKSQLENLTGKSEYSIQIFYDYNHFVEKIEKANPKFLDMKVKIGKMPKGSAYLFQKKYDLELKDNVLSEISSLADEFVSIIKNHTENLKFEEKTQQVPEKYKGMKYILSLVCLIDEKQIDMLGEALDEINKKEGLAVRFTGPWAPFSFVDKVIK